MDIEYYIEKDGVLHKVDELLTYCVISKCDEVYNRSDKVKIGTNLQGRPCPKCAGLKSRVFRVPPPLPEPANVVGSAPSKPKPPPPPRRGAPPPPPPRRGVIPAR